MDNVNAPLGAARWVTGGVNDMDQDPLLRLLIKYQCPFRCADHILGNIAATVGGGRHQMMRIIVASELKAKVWYGTSSQMSMYRRTPTRTVVYHEASPSEI